jgi:hypothetical protein
MILKIRDLSSLSLSDHENSDAVAAMHEDRLLIMYPPASFCKRHCEISGSTQKNTVLPKNICRLLNALLFCKTHACRQDSGFREALRLRGSISLLQQILQP